MVNFNELADASKVWIYQADRRLTETEQEMILKKLNAFTTSWTAHNEKVKGYGEIRYDHFIILIADETEVGVSGCSIDSSVHFIQALGQELDVNFFDRFCIAYQIDDEVQVAGKDTFQRMIHDGKISDSTIVFNNLIQTKADLQSKWQLPLASSWHASFFSVPS